MSRTSKVSDLRTRLEQKSEQERRQIEEPVRSALGKLSKNLQHITQSELATRREVEEAARS